MFGEYGVELGADDKPIKLVNTPEAVNPTFDELKAFIKADSTDKKLYIDEEGAGYMCADFAEDVHNNAEAAGIRAAWVGIDYSNEDEGHACNAFETTDRGLVYIDCTGGYASDECRDWDTVAYIEIGKPIGLIHIDYADSFDYEYYLAYALKDQEYTTALDAYNREVARYNAETADKTYIIGTPEEKRISSWESELDSLEAELDAYEAELSEFSYVSPNGIVKSIKIHW